MRAGEIRALAERAGIAPGVSVLDLCCGVAGPGRFITRELGCGYLGVDLERERHRHRTRARPAACRAASRSRGSRRSLPARSTWCSCSRPCSPFPTRSRCSRGSPRALTAGGRFAFTLEEGQPLTRAGANAHARRRHGLAHPARGDARRCLERAGLVVRWQEDCSLLAPRRGGVADRRVRRRCDGHRRADRTPGAGRAAGRPPALERLARDRARPQDRVRGGEAGFEAAPCSLRRRGDVGYRYRRAPAYSSASADSGDDPDRPTGSRRVDDVSRADEDRHVVNRPASTGPCKEDEIAGPEMPRGNRRAVHGLAVRIARQLDPEPAIDAVRESGAVKAEAGRASPQIGESKEAPGDSDDGRAGGRGDGAHRWVFGHLPSADREPAAGGVATRAYAPSSTGRASCSRV